MAATTPSPAPSNLAPTLYNPPPTTQQPPTSAFTPPTYTTFPPFYTLQPNFTTRARQLALWSNLILSHCASHNTYRLSLSSPPANLFSNPTIHRALSEPDIRTVLDHMSLPANGSRVEWIAGSGGKTSVWVYWRTLAEWADLIYGWVDETGQKGAVLTVYELREGEAVLANGGREWVGIEEDFLRRVLSVLVKRGRAQVFGQDEGAGVKFF